MIRGDAMDVDIGEDVYWNLSEKEEHVILIGTLEPKRLVAIREFEFKESGHKKLVEFTKGRDWPVVYIITNKKEAYIGETCSILTRMKNHMDNEARKSLKIIHVVFDNYANKSAALDLEQSLIRLCHADRKYQLQNLNSGQSAHHNYYQREIYMTILPQLWKELKKLKLVNHEYKDLCNSQIFKYSPFTALTPEQEVIANRVLTDIGASLDSGEGGTFIIEGSAGTGKTVLATNLMLSLVNAGRKDVDLARNITGFTDEQLIIHELDAAVSKIKKKRTADGNDGKLKVGLVVPMTSLRKTLKKVFKETNGLRAYMVLGPYDVSKDDKYDVLIVDETHRLAHYEGVPYPSNYRKKSAEMGMEYESCTQLDWIIAGSQYQVLFYDSNQTVRRSDITEEDFQEVYDHSEKARLEAQIRCRGGEPYLNYVTSILSCNQKSRERIDGYDFRLFSDIEEMINTIKKLDSKKKLCRCVAGYSWEWKTKKMKPEAIKKKRIYDIEIEGHKYIWNMNNKEWILREDSINEIGCIHTSQGYDLNYVGVIFGREIDYDEKTNQIVINPDLFFDKGVKNGSNPEMIRTHIINAYRVMLTRGIEGCYVYACNPSLAKYLSNYIDSKPHYDIIQSKFEL